MYSNHYSGEVTLNTIKRIIKKVLTKIGVMKIPTSFPNPKFDLANHERRVKKWQDAENDGKLRTNYPKLNDDSLILDLGGFYGDFAINMNQKYGAHCHIFEVIPDLCERISKAIYGNPKLHLHRFGLAKTTRAEKLFLAQEGSSIFSHRAINKGEEISISLKDASDWLDSVIPGRIVDLIKINIEGGEYELLEHLIATGKINQIKNIQVQFHEDVIPNAQHRMESIQKDLSKTHSLTFQEIFIWENWELK